MSERPIDFTVVIPVYYNEGSLRALTDELMSDVLQALPEKNGEILFVDDGSGDRSFSILEELQKEHKQNVRVIKLSRNFGQVNAIWCGLSYARGDVTAVMSADGQDPCSLIKAMLDAYFNDRHQLIICHRIDRNEAAWRKFTSSLFYRLMRRLCFKNMPIGGFDVFALGGRARETLIKTYQHHGFIQGQILRLGFTPHFMESVRRARTHGRSRWTFSKKLTYLLDGVIGYSYYPLRLMSSIGVVVALLGFLYAIIVLIHKLVFGNPIQGWAPLMIVILVMGGFQMIMLGILGEYLWRTKAQVTAEPPFIVEKVIQD